MIQMSIAAAADFAGAAIDIWIADQGYVVAWETTGFAAGEDIAIEISGVDDPANAVSPPN